MVIVEHVSGRVIVYAYIVWILIPTLVLVVSFVLAARSRSAQHSPNAEECIGEVSGIQSLGGESASMKAGASQLRMSASPRIGTRSVGRSGGEKEAELTLPS